MSIYTTPLQFGYFFALLFAILFWLRSYREERLSDRLLGFIMFFLAMEIQDYTFGFAGINVLWEEMRGFPRYFHLAFAPTVYFYLKSQVNRQFTLGKKEWLQYLPYVLYVIFYMVIFLQGTGVVDEFMETSFAYYLFRFEKLFIWSSYIYYFTLSLKLYKHYRRWAVNEYSDTDTISFIWLRNFIYLLIIGEVIKYVWFILDYALDDLPYEQDWWWQLLTVLNICYVGISGYMQRQQQKLSFVDEQVKNVGENAKYSDKDLHTVREQLIFSDKMLSSADYSSWKQRVEDIFNNEKIYLQPELSLTELSKKLKTNPSILSAVINQVFNKNFNDFVNEYRVKEFVQQCNEPKNAQLTLLGIAYECGFNSKATFNRAVKKVTGLSPKDLVEKQQ